MRRRYNGLVQSRLLLLHLLMLELEHVMSIRFEKLLSMLHHDETSVPSSAITRCNRIEVLYFPRRRYLLRHFVQP
jgi:hypothetical protein